MSYTCAIIEAEPLAEATLKRYIARTDFLDLVWTAASAEEAERKESVDLLWVAMTTASIEPDGALVRVLTNHEQVILVSIYPQGPDITLANLVDFLTKPISFDAFTEAMGKFLAWQS